MNQARVLLLKKKIAFRPHKRLTCNAQAVKDKENQLIMWYNPRLIAGNTRMTLLPINKLCQLQKTNKIMSLY